LKISIRVSHRTKQEYVQNIADVRDKACQPVQNESYGNGISTGSRSGTEPQEKEERIVRKLRGSTCEPVFVQVSHAPQKF